MYFVSELYIFMNTLFCFYFFSVNRSADYIAFIVFCLLLLACCWHRCHSFNHKRPSFFSRYHQIQSNYSYILRFGKEKCFMSVAAVWWREFEVFLVTQKPIASISLRVILMEMSIFISQNAPKRNWWVHLTKWCFIYDLGCTCNLRL